MNKKQMNIEYKFNKKRFDKLVDVYVKVTKIFPTDSDYFNIKQLEYIQRHGHFEITNVDNIEFEYIIDAQLEFDRIEMKVLKHDFSKNIIETEIIFFNIEEYEQLLLNGESECIDSFNNKYHVILKFYKGLVYLGD